jgi:hypothetical protein
VCNNENTSCALVGGLSHIVTTAAQRVPVNSSRLHCGLQSAVRTPIHVISHILPHQIELYCDESKVETVEDDLAIAFFTRCFYA